MIEPGIYPAMTNEQYHSDPAISRSGIMKFDEAPYKYWAEYLNPHKPPKYSTHALDFGSAFHMYVLEPTLFHHTFVIAPERVYLNEAGREAYDEYKAKLAALEDDKRILLSSEDHYVLMEMDNALKKHPEAWALIEGAVYEHSYFWQDAHSGLMVKARPDILHPNMIVDLKTCKSGTSRAYKSAMIEGGYHIQGAMIRDGIQELTGDRIDNVINICIEKTYPWAIAIKIISPEALEAGHKKYKQILLDMKQCFKNNDWPSYDSETVDLPAWA